MNDAEGYCKTCRWWGELAPVDPIVVAMKGNYRIAQCTHPKLGSENACIPIDGAMDGEAYGGIYSGPNFGCVHQEAKDE